MTRNLTKTRGLVAAPPAPFTAAGEIDMCVVKPLADHLRNQGVVGAFVNGTTGEGQSLTLDERKELASAWKDALSD